MAILPLVYTLYNAWTLLNQSLLCPPCWLWQSVDVIAIILLVFTNRHLKADEITLSDVDILRRSLNLAI